MNQSVTHENVVSIHIDKQRFDSPSPTTGAALYQLAGVSEGWQLFEEVHGHDDGSLIPGDATPVELTAGGHFRSRKSGHGAATIYVNTEATVWERPRIAYDDIVKLAFPGGPFEGNVRYTITWTQPDGSEGAVLKGGKVKVADGMRFDVRNTDKS